ncbi:MAG: ZIP family metal transporter [Patescibacteria group bacterium]
MSELYFNIGLANLLIVLVSLVALMFFKFLNNKILISAIIALGSGVLIGESLFELIPEGLEENGSWISVILGFLLFFIIENIIHFGPNHKHEIDEESEHLHSIVDKKTVTQSLIVDILHNFLDGVAVAIAAVNSISSGWITLIGILIHEIPQELSDLTLLKEGKFDQKNSFLINTLVSLSVIPGSIFGLFFLNLLPEWVLPNLNLFAGGSLMFLAFAKMLPISIRYNNTRFKYVTLLSMILIGITLVVVTHSLLGH